MRAAVPAWIFLAWFFPALVPARGGGAEPPAVYDLRGVLRSFDPKTGQATVSHEAIRGYMPAMTMSFELADPAEMRGVQPGDTFSCRLEVGPQHAWIEGIHKENAENAETAAAAAAFPPGPLAASRAAELQPGDALPDVELLDERGTAIHLHDFGGRALAITFIYLRCPLPSYCPLMNRNFEAAQALLDRLGLKEQTHFLSVSLDPTDDTPAELDRFARAHAADRQTWTFATAREDALRQLGGAVGLEFQRGAGGISHNLRTVVVDAHGRIRRVFRGNTWTPQELAAELRAAAAAAP